MRKKKKVMCVCSLNNKKKKKKNTKQKKQKQMKEKNKILCYEQHLRATTTSTCALPHKIDIKLLSGPINASFCERQLSSKYKF
jgi:pullulanase/glycogen debranching enzyme